MATLFTGAPFTVDRANFGNLEGFNTISRWSTSWYGLDALADPRNILLGLAVLFLSRVLGLLYFMNSIDDETIFARSRRYLKWNAGLFLLFFLPFLLLLLLSEGAAVDPVSGVISVEPYKYLHNLLAMPLVLVALLAGVVGVLWGIGVGIFRGCRCGIWPAGAGTVLTVLALLLTAGYNHTAYYPSLTDLQSSLTIYNSSSSRFTLYVMAIVSILVPFVAGTSGTYGARWAVNASPNRNCKRRATICIDLRAVRPGSLIPERGRIRISGRKSRFVSISANRAARACRLPEYRRRRRFRSPTVRFV